MRISSEALPEARIAAVWSAIDLDGNGWMDAGEFGRFFRQGAPTAQASAKLQRRQSVSPPKGGAAAALEEPNEHHQRMLENTARLQHEARTLEREMSDFSRQQRRRELLASRGSVGAASAGSLPPLSPARSK